MLLGSCRVLGAVSGSEEAILVRGKIGDAKPHVIKILGKMFSRDGQIFLF